MTTAIRLRRACRQTRQNLSDISILISLRLLRWTGTNVRATIFGTIETDYQDGCFHEENFGRISKFVWTKRYEVTVRDVMEVSVRSSRAAMDSITKA